MHVLMHVHEMRRDFGRRPSGDVLLKLRMQYLLKLCAEYCDVNLSC